jgi:hypothetical protein
MMQQFLVMKNQGNDGGLSQNFTKESYPLSGLTKEQTDSILNISSHGGNNMPIAIPNNHKT